MHYSTILTITFSCSIKYSAFIIFRISIKLNLYLSNTNKFTLKLLSTSFKMESKLKKNPLEYYLNGHNYLTSKPKSLSLEVILDLEDRMAEEFILK